MSIFREKTMLKSMTAFGRARRIESNKDITVEIKSVNGRYFDCSVKLPRMFSFLEDKVKTYIQERGSTRGKIDVYIGIDILSSQGIEIALDTAYAAGYIAALERLRDDFGLRDDISVMTVAQNRDIFTQKKPEEDLEEEWEELRSVIDEALESYVSMRKAEGEKISIDIRKKMEIIAQTAKKIGELSALDIPDYGAKLEQRIKQYLGDNNIQIDEQRILTECAIFADKISIDEELVRLNSHFDAFREMLNADGPIGRKLDFLLQEINRETNTIGSKANNVQIARLVVDMKGELEKIREQIQNIE